MRFSLYLPVKDLKMTKKEACGTDRIVYSLMDGGYHKDFTYKGKNYSCSLLPNAMSGSSCTILKIEDKDDVNNVTASESSRTVFLRRFSNFKEENLSKTIKEFLDLT